MLALTGFKEFSPISTGLTPHLKGEREGWTQPPGGRHVSFETQLPLFTNIPGNGYSVSTTQRHKLH